MNLEMRTASTVLNGSGKQFSLVFSRYQCEQRITEVVL